MSDPSANASGARLPVRYQPGIVVFEQRPWWEAELKRSLGDDVTVRPCRLAGDALAALRTMPGSLLVVDLSTGQAEGLRLIARAGELVPPSRSLVIAGEHLRELEWPAREFGAVQVFFEPFPPALVSRSCRRFLAGQLVLPPAR